MWVSGQNITSRGTEVGLRAERSRIQIPAEAREILYETSRWSSKICTVTTDSHVNSFIYVATSFDPQLGSSSEPELTLSISVYVRVLESRLDGDPSFGSKLVAT